jgi:REP element-mobilizing transposase RayT
VFHVTARGNDGQAIFRNDGDRGRLILLLAGAIGRCRWQCLAYCLMTNHYHLLIRTPEPNLGDGMRRLNGRYAQEFNRRYERSGHLFQGRFHSVTATRDEQLLEAVRYITLNPVRANLCLRPDDWQWSSHRALLGADGPGIVDVDEALGRFGAFGGDGRERYEAFIDDAVMAELAA